MKAMVIEQFGGEEQLKLKEVPVPVPGSSEVLIRIEYSSVNPVDGMIRQGYLQGRMPHRFPIILGWDAAGVVEARGDGASRFHVGDKVYAYCRKPEIHDGTYAEYVTLDEDKVARMPANIGFREAATVPLAGLTAWQAIFDHARLQMGETVLIQGAAGGVGSFAVQFAKVAEAKQIFATAREEHHLYLLSIGADVAIDYSKEEAGKALKRYVPEGVDVVIDLVGGDTRRSSYALLKPGGRLVTTVGDPDPSLASTHNVRATGMFVEGNGDQLARIAALIEERRVVPPRIEEFDLAHAADAQRQVDSHHNEGKVVLKVH